MDSRRDGKPDGKFPIFTRQDDGTARLIAQRLRRETLDQADGAWTGEREERNDGRRSDDQRQLREEPTA